jgi:hypothetical protein
VLTVEYDVRDDIPEERTSIYRLEPASDELIEKLVTKRFAHIGKVDARTIAEFSGGNARVAIALANTVRHGETLSDFRNEELFDRLFWQRHDPNESLLATAQVCALVYSFQGEDSTSESSEIRFLGSLVGKSGQEIYRDVASLKQRDCLRCPSFVVGCAHLCLFEHGGARVVHTISQVGYPVNLLNLSSCTLQNDSFYAGLSSPLGFDGVMCVALRVPGSESYWTESRVCCVVLIGMVGYNYQL